MEIICKACRSKFQVPDDKVPVGRATSFGCPKCKSRITVDLKQNPSRSAITLGEINVEGNYDAADKPFDFIEEDSQTALVCEMSPSVRKTVLDALTLLEYQITVADSARDALKRMRYHNYDLIVVNETFDCESPESNGVLIYLERMNMSIRRNIFVAMLSQMYRTMDNMMAFHHSVNLIINVKNIEDIGKILSRGITDNDLFYEVFNDVLKETGRL